MNWAEFFHMGGYAFHVWTSWGITALLMLWLFIDAKISNKKIRRQIARQIAREHK